MLEGRFSKGFIWIHGHLLLSLLYQESFLNTSPLENQWVCLNAGMPRLSEIFPGYYRYIDISISYISYDHLSIYHIYHISMSDNYMYIIFFLVKTFSVKDL